MVRNSKLSCYDYIQEKGGVFPLKTPFQYRTGSSSYAIRKENRRYADWKGRIKSIFV